MQTQIEKALNDIARELKAIRKLMERNNVSIPTVFMDNNPWMECRGNDVECLSNNPEEHGWITDEERQ